MEQLIILSIFTSIKAWGISTVIASILGLAVVKNKALLVDKWAKFAVKWTHEISVVMSMGGELFGKLSDTFQKVDDAIAEDGTTDLNTLKEALEYGKRVKIELDDMIVYIKPKK